jgi:EAL domain-containing protein (putative c-di-GMP-specific phosphodiesterase class I)
MISTQSIQELLHALENGEIVPYFQPQIDLRTGGLLGFEVLARWHHRKRGLILPDHFIPIVEVGKLMNSFTERVASAAAGTARLWPKHLKLAINISASQLHDPSLAERLQSAVERGGLRMDRIVVEVTESALIRDLRQARLVLEDLHQTGARLSIDDFGTGYSSLCNLEALPFDEIKIDACFVHSTSGT